jgi:hypothetical protein
MKYINSVSAMVTRLYVPQFQFSGSLALHILKHGLAHNPTLHSEHLNFVLVSLFLAEHTAVTALPFKGPAFPASYVKSF